METFNFDYLPREINEIILFYITDYSSIQLCDIKVLDTILSDKYFWIRKMTNEFDLLDPSSIIMYCNKYFNKYFNGYPVDKMIYYYNIFVKIYNKELFNYKNDFNNLPTSGVGCQITDKRLLNPNTDFEKEMCEQCKTIRIRFKRIESENKILYSFGICDDNFKIVDKRHILRMYFDMWLLFDVPISK